MDILHSPPKRKSERENTWEGDKTKRSMKQTKGPLLFPLYFVAFCFFSDYREVLTFKLKLQKIRIYLIFVKALSHATFSIMRF